MEMFWMSGYRVIKWYNEEECQDLEHDPLLYNLMEQCHGFEKNMHGTCTCILKVFMDQISNVFCLCDMTNQYAI